MEKLRMVRQITGAGSGEEEEAGEVINTELGGAAAAPPAWLLGLMAETFFAGCGVHRDRRKNEKNIFCLGCCQSFCPHCLPSHHPSHPLLQVRRYVYQDVIRLDDLEKLIDCSCIQPYTINSAKVIFLNQRAQSRSSSSCKQLSGSGNTCFTCDRILQYPFNFCSLSCKVDHMVTQGEDLSSILCRFDESDLAISQFEGLHMDGSDHEGQITPDSILEFGGSNYEMGRTDNSEGEPGFVRRDPKTKRRFMRMVSLSNRRKGAPHRSPLS